MGISIDLNIVCCRQHIPVKVEAFSSAGREGADSDWAVLQCDPPVPASSGTISLAIDEDQLRDSERNHTPEQVAYFVIDPPSADPVGDAPALAALARVLPMSSTHVSGDGSISSLDALLIINRMIRRSEPAPAETQGLNPLKKRCCSGLGLSRRRVHGEGARAF
ncbi:MAG: hypothetical protein F9B45_03405 [Phycisphaera sp. RhM]|nr:hypothetical protein [Phycisphaera sp. RhM]